MTHYTRKYISWRESGGLELGKRSQPFNIHEANLVFDNDHLLVAAAIQNGKVYATVDTGALSTDLCKRFADRYPSLLQKYGRSGTTEVRGVGHAESFGSVTLLQLKIRIGGMDTVLAPAHVLLKPYGAERGVGNFGMDLFKQAAALDIDFGAVKLRLLSSK